VQPPFYNATHAPAFRTLKLPLESLKVEPFAALLAVAVKTPLKFTIHKSNPSIVVTVVLGFTYPSAVHPEWVPAPDLTA
jgi:hypothetical protein